MPVVGIALREIDAKRIGGVGGRVNVGNKTTIKDVKLNELPALNKKGLTIGFSFNVEYLNEKKEKLGNITINGDALYFAEKQEKIEKEWKEDKKLPDDVNIEVINAVIQRCLIKGLVISEDLQLPPPIALPFATGVNKEPEKKK